MKSVVSDLRYYMPDKTILKSLLYKHLEYQQLVLEGCTDLSQNLLCYAKWSGYCLVTTFTSKYICIGVSSKSKGLPVSRYEDHQINAGLWVILSDFGSDIDFYYWCRNRVTAKLRELLCMIRVEGPYLLHTITI